MFSIGKSNKYKLNPGDRKSDSVEYNKTLNEFIKEARSNDITITESDIIVIEKELMPDFKNKSYNSLYLLFKMFIKRHSYSIRKIIKITQFFAKIFFGRFKKLFISGYKR